jgi:hypothetical protein
MENAIDELKFGNMSQECFYWLHRNTYLDKHFASITTFTFPANSSDSTKKELNTIIDTINAVKENKELLARYQEFDRKSFRFFRELIEGLPMIENKDEFNNMISAIIADASPVIYKLKEFHQRPRPFQLAAAYKIRLYPFKTMSQDCASYPSASVYFARMLCEVIGNRCPDIYSNMQILFSDICASRLALGLNYQSDIDVAIVAADKMLEDQEFKVKFKL